MKNNKVKYYKPLLIVVITAFLLAFAFILSCSIGLIRFRDLPKASAATLNDLNNNNNTNNETKNEYATSTDPKDIFFSTPTNTITENTGDFTKLSAEENAQIDKKALYQSYVTGRNISTPKRIDANFTSFNDVMNGNNGKYNFYYLTEDVHVTTPITEAISTDVKLVLNGYTLSGNFDLKLNYGNTFSVYDKAPADLDAFAYNPNAVRYYAYNANTKAYSNVTSSVPSGENVTDMPTFAENSYIKVEGSAISPTVTNQKASFSVDLYQSHVNLFDINIVGLQNTKSILNVDSYSTLQAYRTNIFGNIGLSANTLFAAIEIGDTAKRVQLVASKIFGNATMHTKSAILSVANSKVLLPQADIAYDAYPSIDRKMEQYQSNIGVVFACQYARVDGVYGVSNINSALSTKDVNFNSKTFVSVTDDISVVINSSPQVVGCIELIKNISIDYYLVGANLSFIIHEALENGINEILIEPDAQLNTGIIGVNKTNSQTIGSSIQVCGRANYIKAKGMVSVYQGGWVNRLISHREAYVEDGARVGALRVHGGVATVEAGATVGWVWLTQGIAILQNTAKIGAVLYNKVDGSLNDRRKQRPSTFKPEIEAIYNLYCALPPKGTTLISNKDGNIPNESPNPPELPDDGVPDDSFGGFDDDLDFTFTEDIETLVFVQQETMRDYANLNIFLDYLVDKFYSQYILEIVWVYEQYYFQLKLPLWMATYNTVRTKIKEGLCAPHVGSWIYGYKQPVADDEQTAATVDMPILTENSNNSAKQRSQMARIQTFAVNNSAIEEIKKEIGKVVEDLANALIEQDRITKEIQKLLAPFNEMYFLGNNLTFVYVQGALSLLKKLALNDIVNEYQGGRLTLEKAKKQAKIVIKDINERLYLGKENECYTNQVAKELNKLGLDAITPSATPIAMSKTQTYLRGAMERIMLNMNIYMNLDRMLATVTFNNMLTQGQPTKMFTTTSTNNAVESLSKKVSGNLRFGWKEFEIWNDAFIGTWIQHMSEGILDWDRLLADLGEEGIEIFKDLLVQNLTSNENMARLSKRMRELRQQLKQEEENNNGGDDNNGGDGNGGGEGGGESSISVGEVIEGITKTAAVIGGIAGVAFLIAGPIAAMGGAAGSMCNPMSMWIFGGLLAAGILGGLVYIIVDSSKNEEDDKKPGPSPKPPDPDPGPPVDPPDTDFGGFEDPLDPGFLIPDNTDPGPNPPDPGPVPPDPGPNPPDPGPVPPDPGPNPPDPGPVPPDPGPPVDPPDTDFGGFEDPLDEAYLIDEFFGGFEDPLDPGFLIPDNADSGIVPIDPAPGPVDPEPSPPNQPNKNIIKNNNGIILTWCILGALLLLLIALLTVLLILKEKKKQQRLEQQNRVRRPSLEQPNRVRRPIHHK